MPLCAWAQTGNIQGFVRRESLGGGQPVSDATVTAVSKYGKWTARTARRGFYTILGVVPGLYIIRVQKTQLAQFGVFTYCIHADENRRVNLSMTYPLIDYSRRPRAPGPDLMLTTDRYDVGPC